MGAREEALLLGVRALGEHLGEVRVSSLYETAPRSPIAQPDYLNAAVVASTTMSPEELLGLAKAVEWRAGRRPGVRWGPRPLDIDLLLYGDVVRSSPELSLPHALLTTRAFYLEPLAEVGGQLRVPPTGDTVADLLARLGPRTRGRQKAWSGGAASA